MFFSPFFLIDAYTFVCLFVCFFCLSQSLDQLIENTVPSSIRMHRSMKMDDPVCKLTPCAFVKRRLSLKHQPFDQFKSTCSLSKDPKKQPHQTTCSIKIIKLRRELGFVSVPFIASCCFAWLSPLCPLHEWLKCRLHLYCCAAVRALPPPPPSLPVNIFGVVFAKLGERHQSPDGSRCS